MLAMDAPGLPDQDVDSGKSLDSIVDSEEERMYKKKRI